MIMLKQKHWSATLVFFVICRMLCIEKYLSSNHAAQSIIPQAAGNHDIAPAHVALVVQLFLVKHSILVIQQLSVLFRPSTMQLLSIPKDTNGAHYYKTRLLRMVRVLCGLE